MDFKEARPLAEKPLQTITLSQARNDGGWDQDGQSENIKNK